MMQARFERRSVSLGSVVSISWVLYLSRPTVPPWPSTILDLARSSVDEPSFWGHPYTCDGRQVPGLPALCAPQQILFTFDAVGQDPVEITDWIATDELFAAALE